MLRRIWFLVFFVLIRIQGFSQGTNMVTYAGGTGNESFHSVLGLADGTFLIGGQAQDLSWLPTGVQVSQINFSGSYASASAFGFGFILHVSSDLQIIKGVLRFPAGTVRDVYKIRTNALPGQQGGEIFISGSRDPVSGPDGYYIAKLNRNFMSGLPDGLAYYKIVDAPVRTAGNSGLQDPPSGLESAVKQMQPWDVNQSGQVLYASGHDFSAGQAAVHFMNRMGEDTLVDYFSSHSPGYLGVPASGFFNTTGNPAFDLKSSRLSFIYGQTGLPGALRSWSEHLFNQISQDENGNPGRKGAFPDDAFFSGPRIPGNTIANSGPGYTGLFCNTVNGTNTARIGGICFDKRSGDFYIGYSISSGPVFQASGSEDAEPALAAFGPSGNLKWWARLHRETGSGSPARQFVEGIEMDYARSCLVVLARTKGNYELNFWKGNELKLKPGGNGFQNRIFSAGSAAANLNSGWLGKFRPEDGKILHSSYIADLAAGQPFLSPHSNPDYLGYPDLNQKNPVTGETYVNVLGVGPEGEVVISGRAERTLCTRNAYQKMYKPGSLDGGGGEAFPNTFVRVYNSSLDTVMYSSLITGLNHPASALPVNTTLRSVFPVPGGLLFAGFENGTGNKIATMNIPAWGTVDRSNVSGIFGKLAYKPDLSPPPQPDTIRRPENLCAGSVFTFSIPPVPGASSYLWITDASGWTGTSTTQSVELTRQPGAGSGTLSVFPLNESGTGPGRVIALPSTSPPASPSENIFPSVHCQGQSLSYQVKPVLGALSYSWSVTGTGCATVWVPEQNSGSSNSVVILRTASVPGPCSLRVVANGCGNSSAPADFPLDANGNIPAVPVFISSSQPPCAGIPKTYSLAASNAAADYIWTVSGTGFSGTSKGPDLELLASAGAQNGQLSVVAQNDCGQSSPAVLNLGNALTETLPARPDTISGPLSGFCNGNSQAYTVAGSSGLSYLWYTDGNNWQLSSSGNSATLTIPQAGSSNSGYLFARAVNQCGAGNPAAILIQKGKPLAENNPVLPALPRGICAADTVEFYIRPVPGAGQYQWFFPPGWTIQGPQTGHRIKVNAGSGATPGNIVVRIWNECGYDSVLRPAPQIKTNPVPFNIEPAVSGGISMCKGTARLIYATGFGPSAGLTGFDWAEIPEGMELSPVDFQEPLQDTMRLLVSEGALTGSLKVYLQSSDNRCGSANIQVNVGSNPAAARIFGNTLLCPNPPDQIYKVNALNGVISYDFQIFPPQSGIIAVSDTSAVVNWNDAFTGTAQIRVRSVSACGISPFSVPLSVAVGLPSATAYGKISVCSPGPVTLNALSPNPGLGFLWYGDSLSSIPLGNTSAGSFTTNIQGTDTFFVALSNGLCISSERTRIIVELGSLPPAPVANSDFRCGPGSVTLNAVPGGTGSDVLWYSSAFGESPLFSGTAFPVVLNQTDTFYVASRKGGCFSGRTPVIATIKPVPALPVVSGGERCGSGTVNLSASAATGVTLLWYPVPTGGNPLASGPAYTTPVLTDTTTYYVLANLDGCESQRVPVRALVYAIPQAPAAGQVSLCGPGSATLTASVSAGTVRWYASETGGTILASGSNFTTPQMTASGAYFVSVLVNNCESSRSRIDVILENIPNPPQVQGAGICAPGSITLTANAGSNQVVWYAAATGSSLLFAGNPFVTLISQATIFYAASRSSGGCESTRLPVTASIWSAPPAPSVKGDSRCGPGLMRLSANTSGFPLVRWYEFSEGGIPVFEGSSFNVTLQSDSVAYFAALISPEGCESTRSRAVAKVLSVPQPKASADPKVILSGQNTRLSAGNVQGSIFWTPAKDLNNAAITNPLASPQQTTIYKVRVELNGCTGFDSVEVQVEMPEDENIPKVFTPNGDGIFDTWEIPGALTKRDNSLTVFNRWGAVVKEASPYRNDWDGDDLPDGTYYYRYDDGKKTRTGTITIIH